MESFQEPNSQVGSDRLRKAIERNRAKQAKRSSTPKSRTNSRSTVVPDDSWSLPGGLDNSSSRANTRTTRNTNTRTRTGGIRKSVARADDLEFTTAIRKSPRKAPATVSYTTKKSANALTRRTTARRPRSKSAKAQQFQDWLVKGAWLFSGFLLLRLVFSGGGVIDYYKNEANFEKRFKNFKSVQVENAALLKEIDLIKSNARYQRKVVREHLGYIAPNEFLILFPKEKVKTSI